MYYFLSDDGGWMTVSGDSVLFPEVPEGYREVTEAEYNAATGAVALNHPRATAVGGDEPHP
ncbi:hypothetical protein [Kitasatospora aureofaciens]|uniref:hypothetical protein n=1 Tax=Kitasatospora aureofaciens TaxID=1894 RepID=UPI0033E1C537